MMQTARPAGREVCSLTFSADMGQLRSVLDAGEEQDMTALLTPWVFSYASHDEKHAPEQLHKCFTKPS